MEQVIEKSESLMKVSEKKVDSFYLRNIPGECGWADIYLDISGEESGSLIIRSDYGDFSYYWSQCGVPFIDFLCKIDKGYLLNKLSNGRSDLSNVFYGGITEEKIKKELAAERKDGNISKSDYKKALEEIEEINFSTADSFWHTFNETEILSTLYPDSEYVPAVTGYDPGLKMFVAEVWPLFIKYLKENPPISQVQQSRESS